MIQQTYDGMNAVVPKSCYENNTAIFIKFLVNYRSNKYYYTKTDLILV